MGEYAVIVTKEELDLRTREIARIAAQEVIACFKAESKLEPHEATVEALRQYIADRSQISDPREHWANALHIRSIKPSKVGRPKSASWFQLFKTKSGLANCIKRKSSAFGGRHEWCFEDIANAWEHV